MYISECTKELSNELEILFNNVVIYCRENNVCVTKIAGNKLMEFYICKLFNLDLNLNYNGNDARDSDNNPVEIKCDNIKNGSITTIASVGNKELSFYKLNQSKLIINRFDNYKCISYFIDCKTNNINVCNIGSNNFKNLVYKTIITPINVTAASLETTPDIIKYAKYIESKYNFRYDLLSAYCCNVNCHSILYRKTRTDTINFLCNNKLNREQNLYNMLNKFRQKYKSYKLNFIKRNKTFEFDYDDIAILFNNCFNKGNKHISITYKQALNL